MIDSDLDELLPVVDTIKVTARRIYVYGRLFALMSRICIYIVQIYSYIKLVTTIFSMCMF